MVIFLLLIPGSSSFLFGNLFGGGSTDCQCPQQCTTPTVLQPCQLLCPPPPCNSGFGGFSPSFSQSSLPSYPQFPPAPPAWNPFPTPSYHPQAPNYNPPAPNYNPRTLNFGPPSPAVPPNYVVPPSFNTMSQIPAAPPSHRLQTTLFTDNGPVVPISQKNAVHNFQSNSDLSMSDQTNYMEEPKEIVAPQSTTEVVYLPSQSASSPAAHSYRPAPIEAIPDQSAVNAVTEETKVEPSNSLTEDEDMSAQSAEYASSDSKSQNEEHTESSAEMQNSPGSDTAQQYRDDSSEQYRKRMLTRTEGTSAEHYDLAKKAIDEGEDYDEERNADNSIHKTSSRSSKFEETSEGISMHRPEDNEEVRIKSEGLTNKKSATDNPMNDIYDDIVGTTSAMIDDFDTLQTPTRSPRFEGKQNMVTPSDMAMTEAEDLEAEIPPKHLKLRDAEKKPSIVKCNSEELRKIMQNRMSSSPSTSKQMVYSAVREAFDDRSPDVICSRASFSYIVVTSPLYCEHRKAPVTCFVYFQP